MFAHKIVKTTVNSQAGRTAALRITDVLQEGRTHSCSFLTCRAWEKYELQGAIRGYRQVKTSK